MFEALSTTETIFVSSANSDRLGCPLKGTGGTFHSGKVITARSTSDLYLIHKHENK
jgi:hypothetical protein